MVIPLSPSINLSPESFYASGTQINAEISIFNRPDYFGKPEISGITTIIPRISISRFPSGMIPFHIQVSACNTVHDGYNGNLASGTCYQDLSYKWDFGDHSGTEVFIDQFNNCLTNMNVQYGPEAAYLYRQTGVYSITLTAQGKDLNGNIISATTNNICVGGEHYIHRGLTASGTFILALNHSGLIRTTSPIAHDATYSDIKNSLHALSGISEENCTVSHFGIVQFMGDLLGENYSFSGDFNGLVQAISNTPTIYNEAISATYSGVTVADMSSISINYFDSNYDGSNGTSNGTESRPYTTYSDFKSWIEGGTSRGAALKRNSYFLMNSDLQFPLNTNYSNIRIFAYGSGNRPKIHQTQLSYITPRLGTGTSSNPSGKIIEDIVFQDIEIASTGNSVDMNAVYPLVVSQANDGAYPHTKMRNWLFDNIYWHNESVEYAGQRPVYRFISAGASDPTETSRGGSMISRIHFWGGEYDGSGSNQLALIVSKQGRWFSITGSYLHGGGPATAAVSTDIHKIHHVYPTISQNALFKFIKFGSALKGMCINGNSHYSYGRSDYWFVDGCDITGTMNCLDFSNKDNKWTGGYTGHHRNVLISFNKIHTGQIFSQQLGIISYNLFDMTIRYNMFWDCEQRAINVFNTTGYSWAPKLYIYHNLFKDASCRVEGTPYPQVWYFKYNSCDLQNSDYPIDFLHGTEAYIDQWDADYNIFYNNLSSPFSAISVSGWLAAGNDTNGQFADPQFYSLAGDGKFIANPQVKLNWPTGFYDLEYSLNNTDWYSYTNNNYLTIGSYIDTQTGVFFRAKAINSSGLYTINGYSTSDTLSTTEQTVSSQLLVTDGPNNYQYLGLYFDNNFLFLKTLNN